MTIVHGGAPVLYQSCRLLVVKVLLLSLSLFGGAQIAFAQTAVANDYRLNPVQGCFIKALQNKSYVDVPLEKFSKAKIHAVSHPRRPQYFAFKNAGVIHVIPKKCLVTWDTPEDEFDGLNEMEETDDFQKYERLNKAASENRILNSIEVGEMKYFVELGSMVPRFSSRDPSLDTTTGSDFAAILELLDPDITSATYLGGKTSKIKSASGFNLKGGWKNSDNVFGLFSISHNSVHKEDEYLFRFTTISLGTIEVSAPLEIKTKMTNALGGWRFIPFGGSTFRPYFDLLIGLSSIQQKIPDFEAEFSSLGFLINTEFGLEVFIARNLGAKILAGYEYNSASKFKLKGGEETSDSYEGYKSSFNFSNARLGLALSYYFK